MNTTKIAPADYRQKEAGADLGDTRLISVDTPEQAANTAVDLAVAGKVEQRCASAAACLPRRRNYGKAKD